MLDDTPVEISTDAAAPATTTSSDESVAAKPRKKATKKAAPRKKAASSAAASDASDAAQAPADAAQEQPVAETTATTSAATKSATKKAATKKAPAKKTTAKKAATRKAATKKAAAPATPDTGADASVGGAAQAPAAATGEAPESAATMPLFQVPDASAAPKKRTRKKPAAKPTGDQPLPEAAEEPATPTPAVTENDAADDDTEGDAEATGNRRRRRRGGRRRRKSSDTGETEASEGEGGSAEEPATPAEGEQADDTTEGGEATSRRRRRRRRAGEDSGDGNDDPENTVTRVRSARSVEDQITAVSGSTRLEAKKQRRREGRESGRRRAPIVSEAEFLARRESVDRVMVVRQRHDLTQIAVLEDKVLVEHYVARESQTSLIGNVYLGRVQNVLPSMEAAFIDIGRGRNAVLYAGEVNWSALGHPEGQPRKIESVLSSGQSVLVQVTKDPVGHKGARLTSQVSLAGRFLVYVPDGTTSGISRKLPDTERNRLKSLLKEIVPDTAGVIVRTAAEGASETELTRDVERLKARWEDIEAKVARGNAPQLLYGEPDLTLKVVRDLFTEDFSKLIIEGQDAWDTVHDYVEHVAPDLVERIERHETREGGTDVFGVHRIDEQIAKGLDRKVWLPSGGSLIIDRTEAMTVVDVNTGKFTGSGGNLEETVTKNNLEAAEEIVRQLRLRDIGGIIVIDFIDMVLESNRDLVLRRLVECLGRDRTRHQVAEVTSLGLVQMTRKRIGTGLLEAFSEPCEHCNGRGLIVREAPVESKRADDEPRRSSRRSRRGRGGDAPATTPARPAVPSPKDLAAASRPESSADDTVVDGDLVDEIVSDDIDQLDLADGMADVAPVEGSEPAEAPVDETILVESAEEPTAEEPTAEEPTAEETTAEEPAAEEPAAEEPTAEEPTAEEPVAEPEPPKVVTRTRKRSASRPAGPPAALPAAEPVLALQVGGAANGAPTAEPGGDDEHGDHDEQGDHDDAPGIGHVPIKRRSRKR
ncbi:MAG: Rne/Rng family ribonuclease [Nocardioidaceae bacterium]